MIDRSNRDDPYIACWNVLEFRIKEKGLLAGIDDLTLDALREVGVDVIRGHFGPAGAAK